MSSEGVCVFCKRGDLASEVVGETFTKDGLTVHQYCLYFSSGLWQSGSAEEGINGFLIPDILSEVKRGIKGRKLKCSVCKEMGGYIGCASVRCSKVGHFPCLHSVGFLFQHFGNFESFCAKHRPRQAKLLVKTEGKCCICLSELAACDRGCTTLYCPCCKTLFHKTCIQKQAWTAGYYYFRCPVCSSKEEFLREMLEMGVDVPHRDASWEASGQFQDLYEETKFCHARLCICPEGRGFSTQLGKYRMRKCSTCGQWLGHLQCLRGTDIECADCSVMLPPTRPSLSRGKSKPPSMHTPLPATHQRTLMSPSLPSVTVKGPDEIANGGSKSVSPSLSTARVKGPDEIANGGSKSLSPSLPSVMVKGPDEIANGGSKSLSPSLMAKEVAICGIASLSSSMLMKETVNPSPTFSFPSVMVKEGDEMATSDCGSSECEVFLISSQSDSTSTTSSDGSDIDIIDISSGSEIVDVENDVSISSSPCQHTLAQSTTVNSSFGYLNVDRSSLLSQSTYRDYIIKESVTSLPTWLSTSAPVCKCKCSICMSGLNVPRASSIEGGVTICEESTSPSRPVKKGNGKTWPLTRTSLVPQQVSKGSKSIAGSLPSRRGKRSRPKIRRGRRKRVKRKMMSLIVRIDVNKLKQQSSDVRSVLTLAANSRLPCTQRILSCVRVERLRISDDVKRQMQCVKRDTLLPKHKPASSQDVNRIPTSKSYSDSKRVLSSSKALVPRHVTSKASSSGKGEKKSLDRVISRLSSSSSVKKVNLSPLLLGLYQTKDKREELFGELV